MRAHPGFTLIEIVVGIVVSSLVVFGLRVGTEALAASARRQLRAAAEEEAQALGRDQLEELIYQMRPDSATLGGVVGDSSALRFQTWLTMPSGWSEARALSLTVRSLGGSWQITCSACADSVLLRSAAPVTLRYLVTPRSGGVWRAHWDDRLGLPAAVALVSARDTLVFPIARHAAD